MKFDLDSRIDANRQRIKDTHEMLKKVEVFYPFIFLYLSFFAVYFFDIVSWVVHHWDSNCTLFTYLEALTISTAIFIVSILGIFVYLVWPREVGYDWTETDFNNDRATLTNNFEQQELPIPENLDEQLKERYNVVLINSINRNDQLYLRKRKILERLFIYIAFSFISYSIAIVLYKIMSA